MVFKLGSLDPYSFVRPQERSMKPLWKSRLPPFHFPSNVLDHDVSVRYHRFREKRLKATGFGDLGNLIYYNTNRLHLV